MHCRFIPVGRYESTGGCCWGAAKMRTADAMVCEVCGKNPTIYLERVVSIFAMSHFLWPVNEYAKRGKLIEDPL